VVKTFLKTQTLPVKLTADNSGSLYGNTYLLGENNTTTRSLAVGPVSVVAAAVAIYVAVVTIGTVELVAAAQVVTVGHVFTSISTYSSISTSGSGGVSGGGVSGGSCNSCHSISVYEQKNQSIVIKLSKAIDPCIYPAYKQAEIDAVIQTVVEAIEEINGQPLTKDERTLITNIVTKTDVC